MEPEFKPIMSDHWADDMQEEINKINDDIRKSFMIHILLMMKSNHTTASEIKYGK